MFTTQSTAHRSATVRLASVLVAGAAGLSLVVGCSDAAISETGVEPASGKVSLDQEQVRRELIQFENRRAAWAKQYAESREQGTNVNPREHLAHKDASKQ